jgi:hypothetical protein
MARRDATAPTTRPRPRLIVLVVVAALTLAVSVGALVSRSAGRQASSRVLWQADLSGVEIGRMVPRGARFGGNLPGWTDTPWNILGGGSVSVVSDGEGGKALRFAGTARGGRGGAQRAEQVPSLRPKRGAVVWLAFDLKVGPRLGVSRTWQSALQAHNSAEGSPSWSLSVNQFGQEGLEIGGRYREHSLHGVGPTPYGRWTRIVIGEYLASRPGVGWVEVWRDDVQVLKRKRWYSRQYSEFGGDRGSTLFPGTSRFYKFGLYRGRQPYPAELQFRRIAIGTTFDAVTAGN